MLAALLAIRVSRCVPALFFRLRCAPPTAGSAGTGRLPERPMGADCKSVGLCLPRFESWICHHLETPGPFPLGGLVVGSASAERDQRGGRSSGAPNPCATISSKRRRLSIRGDIRAASRGGEAALRTASEQRRGDEHEAADDEGPLGDRVGESHHGQRRHSGDGCDAEHHTTEVVTQVGEQAPGEGRERDLEDGEGEQERPQAHPSVRREQPRTGGEAGHDRPGDVVPRMRPDAEHRSRVSLPSSGRQGQRSAPLGTNVPMIEVDGRMRADGAAVILAPWETLA